MKASLKKDKRLTTIEVDGRIIDPIAYMSYAPDGEIYRTMRERGVRLFMFPIYAGDEGINMESGLRPLAPHFFLGYGEYDFSYVDKVLSMIAPTGDEDVFIIPRVCLEPPIWWQKLHPEELARDYGGEAQRESFSSELWRSELSEALFALIDHINSSRFADKVIGYHVAAGGTEEWAYQCRYNPQFYDYSEVNLRAYRRFLLKRYGSIDAIGSAHRVPLKNENDIKFPLPVERRYSDNGWLRSPDADRRVLDYFDFHNESVADAIEYFCRAVKEYTKNERLVGVFYGYVNTMPQNYKGLHALGRVLRSPHVDFLSTTNGGEGWHFSAAVASALLHGKAWISEGDVRTSLTTGMDKNLSHAMPDNDYYTSSAWRPLPSVEASVWSLTRALARTLTTPAGIWWFDMFGGWFDDPDMLSVIERSVPLLREADELCELFPAEVAFVLDEGGHKYSSRDVSEMPRASWEMLDNMDRAGFNYDCYLLSDVTEDSFPKDKYKLIIFVAAVCPTADELSAIKAKLKCDGKTLLFLGNSGIYSEELTEAKITIPSKPCFRSAEFSGKTYPEIPLPSASFAEDADGYVLSRFTDGESAVRWQVHENYNTVVSLPLAPSAELLRHIALMSGVHLYNREGDIAYAGGSFVALRATSEGYRRICLPHADCTAENVITGEQVTVNDRFIDVYLKEKETVLFKITRRF